MNVYKLGYRFQNGPACFYISIDKNAIEQKQKELGLDENREIISSNIQERNSSIFEAPFGSPYLTFIKGDAILIGKRHVDYRCSGLESFYAMPENREQAQKEFDIALEKQRKHADAYYSQPWV